MFSKTLFGTTLKIAASSDYPDSWYWRTVAPQLLVDRPVLNKNVEADVCVIGGGLSGINTALGLAERGKKVILLETKRVGYGASGRNGGFALSGFGKESELIEKIGVHKTRELYQWTLQAQKLIQQRIQQHSIPCDFRPHHYLEVSRFNDENYEESKEYVEKSNSDLGASLQLWIKEKIQSVLKTKAYYYGVYDSNAFSVHPLNLTLGLAQIAEKNGVQIYEHTSAISYKPAPIPNSEITKMILQQNSKPDSKNNNTILAKRWIVETNYTDEETGQIKQGGNILVNDIVLAGSAYLNEVDKNLQSSTVPIYSYILVTEPLTDEQYNSSFGPDAINYVVADNSVDIDYYRFLPDRRLLYGTFAKIINPIIDQNSLPSTIKENLVKIYPNLKDVKIDASWGGAMSFTPYVFPYIGHKQAYGQDGIWYCTGFGGHGVVATTVGAEIIASAIASNQQDQRYQIFQSIYPIIYIGGPFRKLFAQAYKCTLLITEQYNYWKQSREESAKIK